MGTQEDNGLSLEGLAHRLETLERENAELRQEVSALRSSGTSRGEVPALRSSDRRRETGAGSSESAGQVSRRSLLSKAGAAAVAAVAAGTLLNTREAKALHTNSTGITPEYVVTNFVSAWNHINGQAGVRGEGNVGVLGISPNDQQAGVKGEGSTGVWGVSSKTSYSGVYGEHTGTSGHGTVGIGKGGLAGVLGRNSTGYGGQFEGGKAQLLLKPGATKGKPSGAHTKGEIYMDAAGTLFVCTAGGTPGRWRKVSTTAV